MPAGDDSVDRMEVIDIHAHCVFPEVSDLIKDTPLDRRFPESDMLGDRLAIMDRRGIDKQVLSVNIYWWYEAPADLADAIVALHDRALAGLQSSHSSRFIGLSSVALQFPELAAQQLVRAAGLGLRGASIGGHVNGEVPSGEKYDPFWQKAEELGMPVFMHPNGARNIVLPDAFSGSGDLHNIIGNPLETSAFLSRLIFDGTLDRFPKLKIVLAHAGGYIPSYLGRTEAACTYRPNAKCLNQKAPSAYLKSQVLVDSMVFSDEGIRHLVAELGAMQVVYGSDLPYNWPDTIETIKRSNHLSSAEKRAILGGNLRSLLKL